MLSWNDYYRLVTRLSSHPRYRVLLIAATGITGHIQTYSRNKKATPKGGHAVSGFRILRVTTKRANQLRTLG